MARVTPEIVDHVARLAHLSLTPEERALFARQLDQIIAYAESIQQIDTEAVEPMSHARGTEAFREDSPRPGLERERVLTAAPDAADGLFRVPRVIAG